jgi:hypothetical protein
VILSHENTVFFCLPERSEGSTRGKYELLRYAHESACQKFFLLFSSPLVGEVSVRGEAEKPFGNEYHDYAYQRQVLKWLVQEVAWPAFL